MNSNAQPEHEICPHDGHMLDRTGKCWYCGGIYPVSKPALTVVESEPQVEVESVEAIDATISVQKDDGTFTEPVPFDSFRKAGRRNRTRNHQPQRRHRNSSEAGTCPLPRNPGPVTLPLWARNV